MEELKPTGKYYYSIGEVAAMFNVNTSMIRYWEKEFDVLRPRKNKKGNRLFTERDVRYVHVIYHPSGNPRQDAQIPPRPR